MNILVCCINGSGTSLMMKMVCQKAIDSLKLQVSKLHHCTLIEAKNQAFDYDIVFCPINFIDTLKDVKNEKTTVIGLKNLMSQKEMEEKLISIYNN